MTSNDPALPVSLARELRDMKQRLRKLERRNSLQRASSSDPAGQRRVQIGEIVHPYSEPTPNLTDFGLIVRNDDGTPVFMVDRGGALIPGLPCQMQNGFSNGASNHSHTSGSWTDAEWYGYFVGMTGTVITVNLNIRCGAGISAAEARLRTNSVNSGDVTSEAIALTANGSYVEYQWSWDTEATVNPNDVWYFTIETRITGGSGTLDVYQPRFAVLRSAFAIATNVDTA